MIEDLANKRGHEICEKLDHGDTPKSLEQCDVAIDFSVPGAAFENIKTAIKAGVPVVSGTTGWDSDMEAARDFCNRHNGGFLYASNFSIGMNIFFQVNRTLARLIGDNHDYKVFLEETHHIHKKDAPSGTAISLAEDIIDQTNYSKWVMQDPGPNEIPVKSIREGSVNGIHTVKYKGEIDEISIRHEAFSREGFALGAIIAAEWLAGKSGVYTMADVLDKENNTKIN